MFVYIIIIMLLLAAPVIVYVYFSDKLARQQRQLMFITRQNNELKNNMTRQKLLNEHVNVTYAYPGFVRGIISDYCNLYLSPMENSPILGKVDIGTQIEVLDSAQLVDCIWYEISLPTSVRVNNKGWIKENFLSKIT